MNEKDLNSIFSNIIENVSNSSYQINIFNKHFEFDQQVHKLIRIIKGVFMNLSTFLFKNLKIIHQEGFKRNRIFGVFQGIQILNELLKFEFLGNDNMFELDSFVKSFIHVTTRIYEDFELCPDEEKFLLFNSFFLHFHFRFPLIVEDLMDVSSPVRSKTKSIRKREQITEIEPMILYKSNSISFDELATKMMNSTQEGEIINFDDKFIKNISFFSFKNFINEEKTEVLTEIINLRHHIEFFNLELIENEEEEEDLNMKVIKENNKEEINEFLKEKFEEFSQSYLKIPASLQKHVVFKKDIKKLLNLLQTSNCNLRIDDSNVREKDILKLQITSFILHMDWKILNELDLECLRNLFLELIRKDLFSSEKKIVLIIRNITQEALYFLINFLTYSKISCIFDKKELKEIIEGCSKNSQIDALRLDHKLDFLSNKLKNLIKIVLIKPKQIKFSSHLFRHFCFSEEKVKFDLELEKKFQLLTFMSQRIGKCSKLFYSLFLSSCFLFYIFIYFFFF